MHKVNVNSSQLWDLKNKIKTLEEAIRETESTKNKLHQNVQEVKSEIHTVVSRHLESLRNREVWLLGQVDLIKSIKADSLNQHTEALWQALGQLQGCLEACNIQAPAHTLDRAHQHVDRLQQAVDQCLKRFEELDLESVETEHISLDVQPTLRKEILQFGKVETEPVFPRMEFVTPDCSASSLPQAFEEYEDEEHHVLYKTLAEAGGKGSSAPTIQFGPTKPKALPKNWLFLPPGEKLEPISTKDALQPPFQADLDQWLAKQNLTPSTSIHQWLRDLHGEGEEEGFTLVHKEPDSVNLSPPGVEASGTPHSPQGIHEEPTVGGATFSYFQQVYESSSKQWLYKPAGSRTGQRASDVPVNSPYEVMKYFREISNDTRDWLHKYEKKHKDEDKDICCQGNKGCSPGRAAGSRIPALSGMDIESLDQLVCVQPDHTSRYFSKIRQSKNESWLSTDSSQQEMDDISEVCRANEPCQTLSACLCEEICGKTGSGRASPVKKATFPGVSSDKNGKEDINYWLASQAKVSEEENADASKVHQYFQQIQSSDMNWLHADSKSVAKPEAKAVAESPFSRVPECSSSEWLSIKPKTLETDLDEVSFEWLSTGSPKKQASTADPSDVTVWLKSEETKSPRRYDPGAGKDGLKKWLLCQPTTADITKEVSLDKWLLSPTTAGSLTRHTVAETPVFPPFEEANEMVSNWLARKGSNSNLKRTLSKEDELPECQDDVVWLSKETKMKGEDIKWLQTCGLSKKGNGGSEEVTLKSMKTTEIGIDFSEWLLHD